MKNLFSKYYSLPVQVKASFWFLICTILQRSVSIITTPIFTRLLSTAEYGTYSNFLSWMGILTCFVTMYIFSGIYPQSIVKYDEERSQYSSSMQGLTLTMVVTWLFLYLLTCRFWNGIFSLTTSQMVAMFIIMWSNAAFGFWSAEQRIEYKYRELVLITLVESILQPILSIILIHFVSDKVTGLVWGIAIATVTCYSYLFAEQILSGRVFFSWRVWSYALKLAIPLIPHYISSILLNSSDRIMIQKLVGESQAGVYNLAYTISICGVLINQALLQTIEPWLLKNIKNKNFTNIKKVAYPSLVIVASINLLLILLAPDVIRIFAPSSYYDAVWIMPPIILSVYFMFMYNLFSVFEFYYETTSYISTATGIGAVLNILLNYIFIQLYGYYAAGYTTLFCYILFAIMHYIFMCKICKYQIENVQIYDLKVIVFISGIFVFVGLGIMFTYYNDIIRYGVVVISITFLFVKRNLIIEKLLSIYKK